MASVSGAEGTIPHRIIFCGSAMPIARVQRLARAMTAAAKATTTAAVAVSPSEWKGVLRNVPIGCDSGRGSADSAEVSASQDVVTVAFSSQRDARGPVLVLVNLKYRGNVGTIVRAAVQANCFKAIYFVGLGGNANSGKTKTGTGTDSNELYHWEKNKNKGVKDADISYYSLHNAPLIDKRRFETVHEFLLFAGNRRRPIVGIDGGTTLCGESWSLYSKEAAAALNCNSDIYLAMGAEDTGLPDEFLMQCSSLLHSVPMQVST